jgi:hypothetical protein
MGQNRLYANFSLGPFDIPRRDSIKIILAEFVGGMDYEQAISPETTQEMVQAAGDSAVQYLNERIKLNFDHDYTVPMSPPAPEFTVSTLEEAGTVGNVITFGNSPEMTPDPHQGIPDIAGYRIYRSGTYPFGPWKLIADIEIGDETYFQTDSQEYVYIDREVPLGYGFSYSVTAYDNGHAIWAVDPAV